MHLPAQIKQFGVVALLSFGLAACQSSPSSTASGPAPTNVVPKMGIVTHEIAGQQRLFSSFGFWMMDPELKTRLLACFGPDGTLNRPALRQAFPEAKIVEGTEVVAVALPSGNFTFFLLRDGPLVSLDSKFDSMVRQMSAKANTGD